MTDYQVTCRGIRLKDKKVNKRSTGIDLRVYSGGVKVRTRESGGGLSKGGKRGLLHSQLMELCQLLGGGRRISTPNRLS